MKNLYLMRHGETLFNQRNLCQGVVNSPLMVEGVAQALHTKKAYFDKNGIEYQTVYCSPEGRAIQTTEVVTDKPFTTVKNLHEMNFGKLEGCPIYLTPPADEFATYFATIGGESTAEVADRMNRALTKIMEDPDNQDVLVVAHGEANECFYQLWQQNNQVEEENVLYNCSVLHYQFDPEAKSFTLVDIFNENYETDDLAAAKALNMGMSI